MKKHLLFFGIVALICLTSCSTSEGAKKDNSSIEEKYYTITWKNYDNTILEVDENVKEGTVPTYDGTAPIREDDEEYTYTWTGWAPEVKAATSNQIYTATYQSNKITNYHTVTFDTHGGSGIPPQKVEHGYKITKPEYPKKDHSSS